METNTVELNNQILNEKESMQPIISLCIPSSGRIHFLERTLDSIYTQDFDENLFEVCISDNSSDDKTEILLNTKYHEKKNLIYRKSSEHSYLNLIEALKIGSGKYLKLINDYTALSDNGVLKYMASFVQKYENTNTVLFFNSDSIEDSVLECENIDNFLSIVSYMDTSAPCFGIYKTSFDFINSEKPIYNIWFPHVSLLYNQVNSKFVVINKKILSGVPVKKKGGYNLPLVFGKEYIGMNEVLLKNSNITKKTFDYVRLETLDFIANWYSMSKYDKKHCAFDFTDIEKWLLFYYKEDELSKFYKLVSKHNKKIIIRKVLFIPLWLLHNFRKLSH